MEHEKQTKRRRIGEGVPSRGISSVLSPSVDSSSSGMVPGMYSGVSPGARVLPLSPPDPMLSASSMVSPLEIALGTPSPSTPHQRGLQFHQSYVREMSGKTQKTKKSRKRSISRGASASHPSTSATVGSAWSGHRGPRGGGGVGEPISTTQPSPLPVAPLGSVPFHPSGVYGSQFEMSSPWVTSPSLVEYAGPLLPVSSMHSFFGFGELHQFLSSTVSTFEKEDLVDLFTHIFAQHPHMYASMIAHLDHSQLVRMLSLVDEKWLSAKTHASLEECKRITSSLLSFVLIVNRQEAVVVAIPSLSDSIVQAWPLEYLTERNDYLKELAMDWQYAIATVPTMSAKTLHSILDIMSKYDATLQAIFSSCRVEIPLPDHVLAQLQLRFPGSE
eukprot:TRINITY_DN5271_c0_g1_i2.p1 TRINITY_DN5271_c0_g1~~TRINITY_DN5271_c0_g1_i2.p1  ORF type:complete len:387 (-),score=77.40 TRINITY_DN5271_c0_g1_i2:154-1314(-)